MSLQKKLSYLLSMADNASRSDVPDDALPYLDEAMIVVAQTEDGIDKVSTQVWKILDALLDTMHSERIGTIIKAIRKAQAPEFFSDFLMTVGVRIGDRTKNYMSSLEMHKLAFDAAKECGDQMSMLRALSNMVFCMNELEEYNEALPLCQRGLKMSEELESVSYLAKFIESYARILLRTGKNIEAARFLQDARRDSLENGFDAIAADLSVFLAEIKADAGDLDEAAALSRDALEEIRLLESKRLEAELITRVGALLMRIEDWKNADEALTNAVHLGDALKSQDQGNNLHNLAVVRSNLGHWADAAKLEEKALTLYESIGYSMGIQMAKAHLKRYRVKANLGKQERDSSMLGALARMVPGKPASDILPEEEQEINSSWLDFLKEKQWIQERQSGTESNIEISAPSPQELLRESEELVESLISACAQYQFNYDGLISIQAAVPMMLETGSQLRAAADIIKGRWDADWENESAQRAYLCMLLLGLIRLRLGESKSAVTVLSEAASQCQANEAYWPEIAIRRALAQALQELGQIDAAFLELRRVTLLLQQVRREIAWDDRSRRLFMDSNFGFLEEMVEAAYQAREPEAAFLLLENHRGRAFMESFRAKRITDRAPAQILKKMKQLQRLQNELRDRLIRCRIADTEEQKKVREQLMKTRREMEFLEIKAAFSQGEPLSWDDLNEDAFRRKFPSDSHVVHYFVARSAFYIIVGGKSSWRFIKRETCRSELEKNIRYCRDIWEDNRNGRGLGAVAVTELQTREDALSELSDLLLNGVLDNLDDIITILIIPHDVICLVPFEALEEPGSRALLADTCELSYIPTFAILSAPKHDVTIQTNALVAGVSSFKSVGSSKRRFVDLPNVKKEVEIIASSLGVEAILNEDFDKEYLLKNMSSARLIHLATHGYSDPEDPLLSSLIMSDGTFLKAADVAYNLLCAECVTISACQTAVGILSRGEGILGLAHAFLVAGARSVIASLWRVDDESTFILFNHFYSQLNLGASKSEALCRAKNYVRSYTCRDDLGNVTYPFADPFYWAPFILIGDREETTKKLEGEIA